MQQQTKVYEVWALQKSSTNLVWIIRNYDGMIRNKKARKN